VVVASELELPGRRRSRLLPGKLEVRLSALVEHAGRRSATSIHPSINAAQGQADSLRQELVAMGWSMIA
jgi:hypothetical protein